MPTQLTFQSPTAIKIRVLLTDYGYLVSDGNVIQKGVPGYTSNRTVFRCRNVLDAAEQLAPILANPDFSARLNSIQNGD